MNTMPRIDEPTPVTVSRQEGLLAAAGYLLLTVFFSWPLARHLGAQIPRSHQPADPMHILYGLISGAKNLLGNPFHFFDATFFYPYPHSLSFLDQIFALSLMAAPVYGVTGNPVLAYNLVWLATFVIAGFGTYLLVRWLTGDRSAAFLAGVLFAFHPYRFHSAGILHVVAICWIPLILWALHRWVHGRERRHLFLFAGLSLVQFLSSGYTGVFLLLAVLLYLVVLLLASRERTMLLIWEQRRVLALTVIACAVILIPFLLPSIQNMRNGYTHEHRSLGDSALYSALPQDYVTPGEGSVLYGLDPYRASARQPLFPGIVALGLFGFWFLGRKWRGQRFRAELIFYAVLLLVSAVLALGPFLKAGIRIPLPFTLMYFIFPGASLVRAPARFAALAILGLAVLAGAGWSRLGRRLPRPVARGAGALVTILAAAELYMGPMVLLRPMGDGVPPVYDFLHESPRSVVLLELPMPADEVGERPQHVLYQLYSLHHGKRLVNGVGAMVPPITREMRTLVQSFPDDASVEAIQNLGVGLVLVHSKLYPPAQVNALRQAIKEREELTWVEEQDGVWVLRVVPMLSKG